MNYSVVGNSFDGKSTVVEVNGVDLLCTNRKDIDRKRKIFGYISLKDLEVAEFTTEGCNYNNLLGVKLINWLRIIKSITTDRFILVKDENGVEGYIGLMGRRSFIWTSVIVGAITICLLPSSIFAVKTAYDFVKTTFFGSGSVIDENQESYDDSKIDFDSIIGGEGKTEPIDYEQGEITSNVYSNFSIGVGDTIPLTNPSNNTVYFIYSILDKGGNVLYKSDLIAPGNQVKWVASDYLGNGMSEVIFNLDAYDVETKAQCQGFWFSVTINIK